MCVASSLALHLVSAAAETHEAAGPSPYLIGIIAFVVLMTLLLVVVAFRSVGQRQRFGDRHAAPHHGPGSHAGGHGHQDVAHQNPAQH